MHKEYIIIYVSQLPWFLSIVTGYTAVVYFLLGQEIFLQHPGCSGLEKREYGCRDPSRWPRDSLYWRKLALADSGHGVCQSRLWGTPKLLPSGYWGVFPWGKAARLWHSHLMLMWWTFSWISILPFVLMWWLINQVERGSLQWDGLKHLSS
jgi:hypothetical protein